MGRRRLILSVTVFVGILEKKVYRMELVPEQIIR
jgi:hypothetical protein